MRDIDRSGRTFQRWYTVVDVTGSDVSHRYLGRREFDALSGAALSWRQWPLVTSPTR